MSIFWGCSLLISILLPALIKARATAQAIACMSNLRQLGIATQGYAMENRGYIPAAFGWSPPYVYSEWFMAYSAKNGWIAGDVTDQWGVASRMPPALSCPSAENSLIATHQPWQMPGGRYSVAFIPHENVWGANNNSPKLNNIPQSTALLMEKADTWVNEPIFGQSESHIRILNWYSPWTYISYNMFQFRHPGPSWNVLFPDGHVDRVTQQNVQRLLGQDDWTYSHWYTRIME